MENGLHYKRFGTGRTVVFLHGFLESLSMWDYLKLEDLDRSCLLFDLPGHGQSPLEDYADFPSLHFMAQSIRSSLQELAVGSFDVIGHSMGGYVALLLKRMDPNCGKVILLNSNFWEDSEERKKDRVRVAEIVLKAKDKFINEAIPSLFFQQEKYTLEIEKLKTEAKGMDPVAIAYAALAMRNRDDNSDLVAAHPNEFLLIQGKEDKVIPIEVVQEKVAETGVTLITIADSGHMSYIEQPKILLEILKEKLM